MPKRALIRLFEDKGCQHNLILAIAKASIKRQLEHNDEMENKYKEKKNYEMALMQQQFKHGLAHALKVIEDAEGFSPEGTTMFLNPVSSTKKPKCVRSDHLPTGVKVAFQALQDYFK